MHYHWYYFAELNHRRYNVHRDETRHFKLTVQSQCKDLLGVMIRTTEKERSFFFLEIFFYRVLRKKLYFTRNCQIKKVEQILTKKKYSLTTCIPDCAQHAWVLARIDPRGFISCLTISTRILGFPVMSIKFRCHQKCILNI